MSNEVVPYVSEGEIVQSVDIEASVQRINEALQRIDQRNRRNLEDAVLIGQELHAVKAQLAHGEFGGWLKSHFPMSRTEATRYMQVATLFADKMSTLDNLPPLSVAYLLAQVTTPDCVREAVFSGEIPATLAGVKEALRIDIPRKVPRGNLYQELKKYGVSSENIERMRRLIAETRKWWKEDQSSILGINPSFLDFKDPPNWERDIEIFRLMIREVFNLPDLF